ncbi:MAG: signal peptidase I [Candidatus Cloacimonetes bacterium]|nr:signal peptidase I [Candidatus Cloacimonadota bacterium]
MAKKKKKIIRRRGQIQGYIEAILFAFVVAFPIKAYIFQNFMIPSSSMESTLLIGDYLVGNRLKYFFTEPKRGDIVMFYNPEDPEYPQPPEDYLRLLGPIYWDKGKNFFKWHQKLYFVKRVIGLPGDKIEVKDKHVFINDEEYKCGLEQYVDPGGNENRQIRWNNHGKVNDINYGEYDGKMRAYRDNFGPVTVPEGNYFVMGDNRDLSSDSRYWGFLEREAITGSPLLIFFSYGQDPIKNIRYYNQPRPKEIRWGRFFKILD